jgi:tRNA uridine 5-carboxymethylaminomethyl modification enzyme
MFTSRAEYRLLLRMDNARDRLMSEGRELGLISETEFQAFASERETREGELDRLRRGRIHARTVNPYLKRRGLSPVHDSVSLVDLLRRPEIRYADLRELGEGREIPLRLEERIEIEVKYEGYIERMKREARQTAKMDEVRVPEDLEFEEVTGLSREGTEKLRAIRPRTLGQARRIPGMTPADLTVLFYFLKSPGAREEQSHGVGRRGAPLPDGS